MSLQLATFPQPQSNALPTKHYATPQHYVSVEKYEKIFYHMTSGLGVK